MAKPRGGSILGTIRSIYNSLTKSEQKVADVILAENEKIIYSTITDFSEICGVSDATVLRFCRSVGFKGYQSFKLELAIEIANIKNEGEQEEHSEITGEDSLEEIARKTINSNLFAINETMSLLDFKALDKAVDVIVHSRKISLFGAGLSQITAQDAVFKFMRLGLDVSAYANNHIQLMQASLLSSSDVAIGISFSGSTQDTFEILNAAKNTGAKIISITHHAKSPITKISDIVLIHGSKEGPLEGGLLSSKVSQLVIVDILFNSIFKRMSETANQNKELALKALSEKLR
ncbi:MurR/RpiR family transcriptional regulator [Paenibacillus nasutitermitis]|uniref:N-acetylmannosamine kinase n=1 Tax=Paenibacillus nasutitermitis TaxID=1652958 RepID=A0A916YTC0_9BACL|nr:MurR/RpiR family transcriptional regulator [Paenibacillus nasutitermitis]GGD60106.1 N-acetylmannosamine kinase [Paenibacillus nasutitermitis]